MQNSDITQVFQEYLLKDEKILWSGQPDPNIIFTPMDFFLVPFSLLWGGFAIFWEAEVLTTMSPAGSPFPMQIMFPLFGSVFVIVGLYFMFGRFIFKKWKKRRTFYAVTNRRILSVSKGFGQQFQEFNIRSLNGISKRIRADGIGTLTFGGNQSMFFNGGQFYGNTGMEIMPFYNNQLAFYDIPDANNVHKLLAEIQSKGN
jgi:hypothetical protein